MITDQHRRSWVYNLSNLPARPWPFAHALLDQTIPGDLYAEMQANMPPHEEFVLLSSTGRIGKGAYPQRFIYNGGGAAGETVTRHFFWEKGIKEFLLSREFALALGRPYGLQQWLENYPDRWAMDTLLIEDLPGYRIGPHADAPHKVLSALFYLCAIPPETPNLELLERWGTSLYAPHADADADPKSGRHYEFEQFDRIATVPYAWNSGLSFVKSDTSWHGVETIPAIPGERRIVLLADIKLRR